MAKLTAHHSPPAAVNRTTGHGSIKLDQRALVTLIVLASIGVRLVFGLFITKPESLEGWFYDKIALELLAQGNPAAIAQQGLIVERMPLYPILLALIYELLGHQAAYIVIVHSLLSGALVLVSFYLAQSLYGIRAGLVAALIVAVYPYYVGNNVGLSDELIFTLLLGLVILFALKLYAHPRRLIAVVLGGSLGLTLLTRSAILVFVPLLAVWLMVCLPMRIGKRLELCTMMLGTVALLVAPWTMFMYSLVGRPTLTAHLGFPLWNGNNPVLRECGYPEVTIDLCARQASSLFAADEMERFKNLNYVAQDDAMMDRALLYIRQEPLTSLQAALTKLGAAYSWNLNPYWDENLKPTGAWWKFAGYTWSYLPLAVLALVGFVHRFARMTIPFLLIGLLYLALSIGYAIFWAHTAHRAPLDLYMIVIASGTLAAIPRQFRPQGSRRSPGSQARPPI